MDKKKKKEKTKAEMPRPRSKTTVSSKKSDCEDLQHTLKKEPEDLRLRITELEAKLDQCVKKISQREQERDKALDDLAIVQARAEVFRNDFEEERRDRVRAHQELEEFKNHTAPKLDENLEDVLQEKNQECIELKDQLANSEIKSEMQLQRIATLEDELAAYTRMNDQNAQTRADYENDLHFITRELEDKKQEIQVLNEMLSQERRNEGPAKFFTLKDQLDISESMCRNLHREKERAEETIMKLEQENKDLRRQSLTQNQERDAFSPTSERLPQQVVHAPHGHGYRGTRNYDSPGRVVPPSERDMNSTSTPRVPERHHEYASPQFSHTAPLYEEDRSSTPASRHSEYRVNRSSSDGEVANYNQEQWEHSTNRVRHQQHLQSSEGTTVLTSNQSVRAHDDDRENYIDRSLTTRIYEAGEYSSILPHENELRYTRALEYISLEIGDLSESEKTSLKGIVEEWKYSQEEELDNDIRSMCDKMRDLRHERLVERKTNIHMALDPNLVCPNCEKQFREGEIQKFKDHAEHCGQKW